MNILGSADHKKICEVDIFLCWDTRKYRYFLIETPDSCPNFRKMRSTANRRRSTRNRRNRQQTANEREELQYTPKLKYSASCRNEAGVFVVTKRKRALPSPEQIEAKKMRQLQVQQRKYFVLSLRHKVVNMWLHGSNFNNWQFAAGNTKKIIEFLQASFPKYAEFAAARSFVYRAIDRFKRADPMPSLDPFRDLRGEGKPKQA